MQMHGWNILTNKSSLGVTKPDWKALAYFNFYRLVLSGLFVILYMSGPSPSILGSHHPSLFFGTAVFYLSFSVFSLFTILQKQPSISIQTQIQILTDIVCLTLLMHSSGGLTTGLGILLVISSDCSDRHPDRTGLWSPESEFR